MASISEQIRATLKPRLLAAGLTHVYRSRQSAFAVEEGIATTIEPVTDPYASLIGGNKPLGLAELGFQNSAWNWTATTESFWDVVVLRQIKAEMPAVRYAMFWNDVFAPGVGKSTSDSAVRMLADPCCVLR